MYLLDTNIISELMRQKANQNVIKWLDNKPVSELLISLITVAEIKLGVALLPEGKRKMQLKALADEMLQEFGNNCRSFDFSTASIYSEIVASCIKQGRAISTENAQIAAICKYNKATLVTRNIRDFEMITELELHNPFD